MIDIDKAILKFLVSIEKKSTVETKLRYQYLIFKIFLVKSRCQTELNRNICDSMIFFKITILYELK